MCTFNDIPEVLQQVSETIAVMNAKMDAMKSEIASLKAQLANAKKETDGELICGIFKRGEIISMSDRRLWEGESAPFKSRDAVGKSRMQGCMWLTTGGQKSYRIKAETLQDWLLCKNIRKKLTTT